MRARQAAPPTLLYEPYNGPMPVTVADIVEATGDNVRVAAGHNGLTHPIRWVHVSELPDPTPWLKGGELLLTTGMGLPRTASGQRGYLERLERARLAGLGLGTGFSYRSVPKALRTVADRLSFPLLEVPYSVPFIAITEAVFSRLAAEQLDVLRRALDAQTVLTNRVLKGQGVPGVVEELARTVGGWVAVLDLHGLPLASWPASAAGRAAALWEEIRTVRPVTPGSSVSLSDRGQHVSVQPVGVSGRIDGFLVMATWQRLGQFERIVASHALSLLAIELDKTASVATAERRLRGDFLDALVAGSLEEAELRSGLRRFGFRPGEQVRVMALQGAASIEERASAVEEVLARRTAAFLASPRDGALLLLLPEDANPSEIREEVTAKLAVPVVAGVGSAVPPGDAGRSQREARHALRICEIEGKLLADFRSLGTHRLLLTLQEPDALRAFADAVLHHLDEYDEKHGGELIGSLRAFLDQNARWEAAAADLFVHRHTLRYRMRKVEELTGRDLDTSRDRMEFWLALQARELLARPDEGLS